MRATNKGAPVSEGALGQRDGRLDLGRRDFLRIAWTVGAATAAAGLPQGIAAAAPETARGSRTRVAWRLSTRGMVVCNACKGHAANRFYASRDAADGDRAHTGCNCRIVPHSLHRGTWSCMFARGDVYDRRWDGARCPEFAGQGRRKERAER